MNKSTTKSEVMVLTEVEAMEFFANLISSARTQLDDPALYASMRLLSAAENLREFIKDGVSEDAQRFLEATYDLTTHAQINMADVEDYTATLDELCRMTAQYLVDEFGLGEVK